MKRVLSLFIILTLVLSVLSACVFLPDDIKLCQVNFYVDNELYDTKSGIIGQPVNLPSAPQKENLIFMGWYTTGVLSSKYDSDTKLMGNVDLYAYYVIDAIPLNDMIMKETINGIVTIENRSYNTASGSTVELNFDVSQGSGVVVDISGGYCYVLTNYHVVEKAEGFTKQKFSIEDPWGNVYEAQIYKHTAKPNYAMSSDYDLALLCFKYNPTKTPQLEEISIGKNPKVDEYVVSIGAPNGLQNAVTYGIVRAYQEINAGKNENLQKIKFQVAVHDAFIDHGSSGGALINMSGELVGINFAGYNNGEYGCAIPIEKVLEFMNIYVY